MLQRVTDERIEVGEPRVAWNTILVALGLWNRWFENPGPIDGDPYPDWPDLPYPHGPESTRRLLARVILRPQRQQDKRDKVVLCHLAPYRRPFRQWPLLPTGPERWVCARTARTTATELAGKSQYYLEHSDALEQATSREEEIVEELLDEWGDKLPE